MPAQTSPLHITFLTLFPDAMEDMMRISILGRAQKNGLLHVKSLQIRDYATDKHQTVDDTPCGGGAGQVMRVDVLHRALQAAKDIHEQTLSTRVILLDPAGSVFQQDAAKHLAQWDHLIFLCGRYEGVDARIWQYVDEVWSLGDFVISGGELAGLIIADAVSRMRPGVLGNSASIQNESHMTQLLEPHQYTRPIEYDGWGVPEVLLGGHHGQIQEDRKKDALARTQKYRPDLLADDADAKDMILRPVRKENP